MQKYTSQLLLAILLITGITASAQTVVWSDDFESYSIGTTEPGLWYENTLANSGHYRVADSTTADLGGFFPVPDHGRFLLLDDDSCGLTCQATPASCCANTGPGLRIAYPNNVNGIDVSTTPNPYLTFNCFFYEGNSPFGNIPERAYVQVSTNGGFTWTTLDSIRNTGNAWDSIQVDLSAYGSLGSARTDLYVSIVYNDFANWAFGIAIDDVRIIDLPILAFNDVQFNQWPTEYVISNLRNIQPFDLDVFQLANAGTDTLKGVSVTGEVRDGSGATFYTMALSGVGTELTPGSTALLTDAVGNFTPNDTGLWTIEVISTASNAVADTLSLSFLVDDTLYQRDFNTPATFWGQAGANQTGAGNIFDVTLTSEVFSISGRFNSNGKTNGSIGDSVFAMVYDVVAGVPTNLIATSIPRLITAADTPYFFDEFFFPNQVVLAPGEYFMALQMSNPLGIDAFGIWLDDNIYTQDHSFINFNYGAWIETNTGFGSPLIPAVSVNLIDAVVFPTNDLVLQAFPWEYTSIPLQHVIPLDLDIFAIENNGSDTLRSVNPSMIIYDPLGVPAYVSTLPQGFDLPPGQQIFITDGGAGFTPNDTGVWQIMFISNASNADADTIIFNQLVDDSLYARDYGTPPSRTDGSGNAQFGAANVFDVLVPAQVYSVEAFFSNLGRTNGSLGDTLIASVFNMAGGVPTTRIVESIPLVITALDTPVLFNEFFFASPLVVTAGEYMVAVENRNAAIGIDAFGILLDDNIFTTNKSFFELNGGGWTEATTFFGASFVPMVRAVLTPPPPTFDVDVTGFLFSEYTAIPIDQFTSPVLFDCVVDNLSTADVNNVAVSMRILNNVTQSVVYTGALPVVTTLAVSADTNISQTTGGWTPVDTGIYRIEWIVAISQTDVDASNDTSFQFVRVTEDFFARDATAYSQDFDYRRNVTDGYITNSLGYTDPASVGNYGNLFSVEKTSRIEKVGAFINGTNAGINTLDIGDTISARIYDLLGDGVTPDENAFLFESELKIITAADTGQTYLEFDFTANDTILAFPGGFFFVGVHEFSTTDFFVGMTDFNIFNDRSWLFVEGQPATELIGAGFNNNFAVRTFVGDPPVQDYDADVDAFFPSEYTIIPKSQVQQIFVGCEVQNIGTDSMTNVTVTGQVINPLNNVVYTGTFTPLAGMASAQTSQFIDAGAGYTPDTNVLGMYTVRYIVSITETDSDPSNDTVDVQFILNDTLYSRDYHSLYDDTIFLVEGGLGVNGFASESHLGNTFSLVNGASIEGAQFIANGFTVGDTVRVDIFAVNAGLPDINTLLGQTVEHIVTATDTITGFYQLDINGLLNLPAGDYMFAVVEYASVDIFGLTYSNFIYTTNTAFGSVNGGGFSEITLITNPALPITFKVNAVLGTSVACPNINVTETIVGDTCAGGTGEVALAVSGGNGGFTYAWSVAGNTNTISSLSPNNYTVTITDAQSCDTVLTYTVPDVDQTIGITGVVTDASCATANGAVDVTISGFPGSYTYSWSNGPSTEDISGVVSGNYTIVVTGPHGGCVDSNTFSVSDASGPSVDTLIVTDISCNGDGNGAITSTVTGGTGSLVYAWSNSSSAANISGLSGGLYQMTVTDSLGCQGFGAAVVDEPAVLTISRSVDSTVLCFGDNNGQITATVSGGTPNYTYVWSAGAGSSTNVASNLAAGPYTLTVSDANSCTATTSATVAGPTAALTTSIGVNIPVSCNGGNNGQLSLNTSGGTSPYSYLWNTNPLQITSVANNLAAGPYSVTVTDKNGCTTTTSGTINEPAGMTFTVGSLTDPSCNGDNDGAITVSATGGNGAPFTYSIPVLGLTGPSFSNLSAGSYSIRVRDAANCRLDSIVTLSEPNVIGFAGLTTDNDTCLSGVGGVNFTVVGGNGGFGYAWSNSAVSANISNVIGGNYEVTVTDSKGCDTVGSFTVTNIDNNITATSVVVNSTCGGSTGAIDLTRNGGWAFATYGYAWSNGPSTEDITALSASVYTVTITDNYGCTDVSQHAVNDIGAPTISNMDTVQNVCFGETNGQITATVSGGTPNYSYAWSAGGSTTNVNANLAAGVYTLTVTDAVNCKATSFAIITEPTQLVPTASVVRNVDCFGNNNGEVTSSVTGGTPGYGYNWGFATGATQSGLTANTYTVTITDNNSCTVTASAIVTEPAQVTATFTTTDVSCSGGNDGQSIATIGGGVTPYSYAWSSLITDTSFVANDLVAGVYSLTITDDSACVNIFNDTVYEPEPLTINLLNVTNASCAGLNDGSVQISTTGGVPNYQYTWSHNGALDDTIATGLTANVYDVTVTDANNCTATRDATVFEPQPITVTIDNIVNATDANSGDGAVFITVTGGTIALDYDYQWSNGATSQDIQGLNAGNYFLTVTDNNGCSVVETATVGTVTGLTTINNVELLSIYPNPTASTVNFELVLNQSEEVYIEIFSVIGEKVFESEMINTNEYTTTVDLREYASGIYLAKMNIGSSTIVRRVILNR